MATYIPATSVQFKNDTFKDNQNIISVDLRNIPWQNNTMCNAFNNCTSLQTVTNINQNVTNMGSTFYGCSNLVNAPIIPNSVTNMYSTFRSCDSLVNAPVIPNSVTNTSRTFYGCQNLTGNVYIHSNQISGVQACFNSTSKEKNVYIPFKYENGVYTQTYNSFINAGYSTTTRKDGALLFDINPPKRKYIETEGYEFTNANDTVSLTKYTGTSTTVTVPTIQEE